VEREPAVERRIVTVLFADLVGFTSLSEQLDAEDVATIQDAYFDAVRETIGRWGGRLEKFIGDAAMAVFGAERVHEDDARRAVHAGLALTHAIEQIGARLGLDEDVLRLRVGVNTGEAVIATGGTDEGRVTGDTVNTAARLQTAAPPGRVLVGADTSLAVADSTELERVEPLSLKGKAEPVPAWLVSTMHPEPSREQAMGSLRAPTLGRESELGELAAAYRRVAGGGVERWLVVAPPGVGKSRLLRELTDRLAGARPAPLVLRTRAKPDVPSPFDPIAHLLLDSLSPAAGGPPDEESARRLLLDRLAAAGASPERAQVVTDAALAVVWPPDIEPRDGQRQEREVLFAAWLEALDALAAGRPAVWLVEDVHWAGGDVLAFVDFATARQPATGGGRLLVATARPSLLETHLDWAAADAEQHRHHIQLATLAPTAARELVHALVGDALPDALVEQIAQRSDGNCLFIEELLRAWVSVGTLAERGGRWRLTVPAEHVALPASVQSIYAAQLDDLPAGARQVARRASVAGKRFPVGALESLGVDARTGLDPLRRRALVVGPQPEAMLGEAYAYRHALLRDAGYASLARAERARLHVRLARWLEAAAGERSGELADQIAGHYAAALESAPALARELDEGVDRATAQRLAAEWYERAGKSTLAVSAHDAARQLFRRAIDLTPGASKFDLARLWEQLADATAFAADMDEGARAYEQSMELYREAMAEAKGELDAASRDLKQELAQGADELRAGMAELDAGMAEVRAALANVPGGAAIARALPGGPPLPATVPSTYERARSGLARATAALADVMYQQLRFADSEKLAAGVMAEIGSDQLASNDPGSLAKLLIARALGAMGSRGGSAEIEAELQQATELAAQSSDRRTQLHSQSALAAMRAESGRPELADWAALERSALDQGAWKEAISAAVNAAAMQIDDHAREVIPAIQRAREIATAHGYLEDVAWTAYIESEAWFVAGEWDQAIAAGVQAMDVGEANAYRRLTVRTVHVMVPIAAVRGDRALIERAQRFYESLEGRFEFPDSPYSRIVRAAQDLEIAAAGLIEPFVPEVEPRIVAFEDEPGGGSWSAALDRVFRSWLEAGELDGAERALAAATAALPRFQNVSRLGHGSYELLRARLSAAQGDDGAAAITGRAALEHFRAAGAPWWVAKAIRLLERANSADYALVGEAFEIERHLGAIAPIA
jgi:class 3 adenylate cyclase